MSVKKIHKEQPETFKFNDKSMVKTLNKKIQVNLGRLADLYSDII